MARITRLGLEGYGVRKAGNFSRAAVITGNFALIEAPDVAAFTGTPVISGNFALIEAPDVAAFSGAASWLGTLTVTETPDVIAVLGVVSATNGALATTEATDIAVIVGTLGFVPIEHIYNGEPGFDVRAKLNAVIDFVNASR